MPPSRIKTAVRMDEPASFAAYVNRFKDADTLIFADITDTGAKFTAVLDYHKAPENQPSPKDGPETPRPAPVPRYLNHTCTFELQPTTEWKRWTEVNGKKMDQATFATWLEDNLDLFIAPPGAELLELVLNLEGHSNVRFTAQQRLNNGKTALAYDEDVEVTGAVSGKSGRIVVPDSLQLAIAPFQGTDAVPVRARLKHRIQERKVVFWLETVTPHVIVRNAVQGILLRVIDQTKIDPLHGKF